MQHNITYGDGEVIVQMEPKLKFEDHNAFREIMTTLEQSDRKRRVFDLSKLESIDSAGLGMIMIAFQSSQKQNCAMVLRHPQGQVKRLLEITDLGKVIEIQH